MLNHLRGAFDSASLSRVVIDVNGLGYEVSVPLSTQEKMPAPGNEVKLFIVESSTMYGGATTLYGFLTEEERDIFTLLKDEVPGAGARKALEYLDKVTKSLPDFRRAIVQRDSSTLVGVFGFTKKTAEKLVAALKDKISEVTLTGKEKWIPTSVSAPRTDAIAGLMALGYRENQARAAVEQVLTPENAQLPLEEILRKALRHL